MKGPVIVVHAQRPRPELTLGDLIPGGILESDHRHHITNDNTCSRCRRLVAENEVPLMAWVGEEGEDLLIYCSACLGWPEELEEDEE